MSRDSQLPPLPQKRSLATSQNNKKYYKKYESMSLPQNGSVYTSQYQQHAIVPPSPDAFLIQE